MKTYLSLTSRWQDVTEIIGRDIGLMMRAFASALEDDNLLVRRSCLDLLVDSLRIDSFAMKRYAPHGNPPSES